MNKNSSISFWHTPIDQVVYDFDSLSDYYIDLTSKCDYKGPFDNSGIPMLDYKGDIGVQYNPCACAQYALGWFQLWLRHGVSEAQKKFFQIADWLCETQVGEDGKQKYWLYHFDLDAYNVKAPWKSGLAQAQAISVLARAVAFCENSVDRERYTETLEAGFAGLAETVELGGLTRIENDDLWIEEVVTTKRVAILDGCIFSLFGVKDYLAINPNSRGYELFENGCATIIKHLPEFNLGYWSRADLFNEKPPMPSSFFYHNLHVHQLNSLFEITQNKTFREYAKIFDMQQRSRMNKANAFVNKAIFKVRYY